MDGIINLPQNPEVKSKLYFVKTTKSALRKFETDLKADQFKRTDTLENQLRSIEEMSLLTSGEKIQGFEDDWDSGYVEAVFHPTTKHIEETIKLVEKLMHGRKVTYKKYDNGPLFVTFVGDKDVISEISSVNMLRAVHPYRLSVFPSVRSLGVMKSMQPPTIENRERVKVGVFDGGVHDGVAQLPSEIVSIHNPINSDSEVDGLNHGTGVVSAILYGELSRYKNGEILEDPLLAVESFRVLPISSPDDYNLYEAIDIVEDVVASRDDISIYNLSFGPVGPILDDCITRFTYALDKLAYKYDVTIHCGCWE